MIIVTGACGFIGSTLANKLYSSGREDILLVDINKDMRYLQSLSHLPYMDMRFLMEEYRHWDKVTHIFHEGAISSTRETNWDALVQNNIVSSMQLFWKAYDYGIPFQYASSASVYGKTEHGISSKETDRLQPQTLYAHSKTVFDKFVQRTEGHNKVQGLRYFNVYGENEGHKKGQGSPIYTFSEQANGVGAINLFEGSTDVLRDFVCVHDVVSAKIHLAFGSNESGIFNIGSGVPTSFDTVANLVAKKYDASIKSIPFPDQFKDSYQYWTLADISKLRATGYGLPFRSVSDYLDQLPNIR